MNLGKKTKVIYIEPKRLEDPIYIPDWPEKNCTDEEMVVKIIPASNKAQDTHQKEVV